MPRCDSPFFALTIFTHVNKSVIGQRVLCITACSDMDIFRLLLLTCLIQNFGKECLCKSLGRVLLGLVILVIRRNLPQRGNRHNRFNFIIPLICIYCVNPSLDIIYSWNIFCTDRIREYILVYEPLVLLNISAEIILS